MKIREDQKKHIEKWINDIQLLMESPCDCIEMTTYRGVLLGIGIVLDALGYVAVQNDEKLLTEIVEGSYAEMEAIKTTTCGG